MHALPRKHSVVGLLAVVTMLTAGLVTHLPVADAAVAPCGSLAANYSRSAPPAYSHVVVLMEENWSYNSFAASTAAPFLTQL
ncbi:MAG: hypothetical protein ACXVYC_08410, partial [Blastococcus sp.]